MISMLEYSVVEEAIRKAGSSIHFTTQWVIDDLHISHNASGMGANIRVLLIRNSSSHSS